MTVQTNPPLNRRSQPKTLFTAVDGHRLELDGVVRRVRVLGVFDAGAERWVQLLVEDAHPFMVTLRVGSRRERGCALVSVAADRRRKVRSKPH